MADFNPAYSRMMKNEGGYRLVNIPGDAGGMTYAGISRRANPDWPGWAAIDRGQTPRTELVRKLYREKYWMPIRGDEIKSQEVAQTIFDFAVNAGVRTSTKLVQITVDTEPDGIFGPVTLQTLNSVDEGKFIPLYTLAKIARYAQIAAKDRTQTKFLLGWILRALREGDAT